MDRNSGGAVDCDPKHLIFNAFYGKFEINSLTFPTTEAPSAPTSPMHKTWRMTFMEKPCILLLGLYSVLAHTAFEPEIRDLCHLCPHHGGHDVNISNPDRNLTFFNLHVANCMDLKRTVGFFTEAADHASWCRRWGPIAVVQSTQRKTDVSCVPTGEKWAFRTDHWVDSSIQPTFSHLERSTTIM